VGGFRNLALANPRTAPYGAAAMSVMQALELFDSLRDKLIFGENIGQAYQFVASGNAELGFVARSQLVGAQPGSYWVVPQALYPELRQQYVVLSAARSPGAAWQFVAWLRSPRAREIIERFGYGTEPPSDVHESEGATPNGAKQSRID
jgi:molybdate transport system substrate-binding protein